MTIDDFVVALNGKLIARFLHREISKDILASMTGIRISSHNRLKFDVSAVDHHVMQQDCNDFWNLTKLKNAEKDEIFSYSSKLFDVDAGHFFDISGKIKENANSVVIEFIAGNGSDSEHGDIPLHICVFFNTNGGIHRASHYKGVGWGKDECAENTLSSEDIRLKPGNDFKFSIFIDSSMFIISVNEKPFCTYALRHSLKSIRILNISGDIEDLYQADHNCVAQPMFQSKFSSMFSHEMTDGNAFMIVAEPEGVGSFELRLFKARTSRQVFNMKVCFDEQSIMARSQTISDQ